VPVRVFDPAVEAVIVIPWVMDPQPAGTLPQRLHAPLRRRWAAGSAGEFVLPAESCWVSEGLSGGFDKHEVIPAAFRLNYWRQVQGCPVMGASATTSAGLVPSCDA